MTIEVAGTWCDLDLPVIPHLKITDMGLVDVDRFELVGG
jgi:adenine deaminase